MEAESPYVGIDVSKNQLDIAVRPAGDTWSMPNDVSGITEVVQGLAQLPPALVVLEATGGLQMPLATAGLPLAMVNPARSETSPELSAGWPRPTGWTPRS